MSRPAGTKPDLGAGTPRRALTAKNDWRALPALPFNRITPCGTYGMAGMIACTHVCKRASAAAVPIHSAALNALSLAVLRGERSHTRRLCASTIAVSIATSSGAPRALLRVLTRGVSPFKLAASNFSPSSRNPISTVSFSASNFVSRTAIRSTVVGLATT